MRIAQLFASCLFLLTFGVAGAAFGRQCVANYSRKPAWPVLEWSVAWLGSFFGSWIILAGLLMLTSSALFDVEKVSVLFLLGGGISASFVEIVCLAIESVQRRSLQRRTIFWMLVFLVVGFGFTSMCVVFRLNYDVPGKWGKW